MYVANVMREQGSTGPIAVGENVQVNRGRVKMWKVVVTEYPIAPIPALAPSGKGEDRKRKSTSGKLVWLCCLGLSCYVGIHVSTGQADKPAKQSNKQQGVTILSSGQPAMETCFDKLSSTDAEANQENTDENTRQDHHQGKQGEHKREHERDHC